jgi:hypothetical protein
MVTKQTMRTMVKEQPKNPGKGRKQKKDKGKKKK